MGIGGAVALSVLMIPVVVRVHRGDAQAGAQRAARGGVRPRRAAWRTIVKVVLRTASAGIATGVTLAIARVIGETAPLLIIVGTTDSLNLNPFSGRMETLPVYTYYQFSEPGVPPEFGIERAWGAALVLILIVMVLNLVARAIAFVFSPEDRSLNPRPRGIHRGQEHRGVRPGHLLRRLPGRAGRRR